MLRFLSAEQLERRPQLAETMFLDRAAQFRDRLNWDVFVGPDGKERDTYDHEHPIYVIWETDRGRHGGSMRFLPTTGRTMVNEHFRHLTDGAQIEDVSIWECTRFCLAPDAEPDVSAALMLGGLELGLGLGLSHAVGVFDARMVRIYRRLGWGPVILGTDGGGRDAISVGLWSFETSMRPRLLHRARLSQEASQHWVARLRRPPQLRAA